MKKASHFHTPRLSTTLIAVATFSLLGSQAACADFEFYEYVDDNPLGTKYDAKTYPGIACEAQAVAEISQFQNLGFMMVNANPGRRNVVCPIVRDNTENTDGTYSVLVHVSTPNNRTTNCNLYSYDQYNVLIDSDVGSTSVTGNATIYLDVDNSVSGGFLGLTCDLANTALVHSYEVREFLETDNEGGLIFGPGSVLAP